jgi:hypothetical protein
VIDGDTLFEEWHFLKGGLQLVQWDLMMVAEVNVKGLS